MFVRVGGVGLAAIQGARGAGAARIVAADTQAGQVRRDCSGTTDTVDASGIDLVTLVGPPGSRNQ
ncbi:MAG: hypothetical protein NVS4B6_26490 [Mycobacterium sp.]